MKAHYVESKTFNGQTQYCIFVSFNREDYIFRYAYDDREQAVEVAENLSKGNKNCNDETTIAFNYWNFNNPNNVFSFGRKTTQKNNWHVIRKVTGE